MPMIRKDLLGNGAWSALPLVGFAIGLATITWPQVMLGLGIAVVLTLWALITAWLARPQLRDLSGEACAAAGIAVVGMLYGFSAGVLVGVGHGVDQGSLIATFALGLCATVVWSHARRRELRLEVEALVEARRRKDERRLDGVAEKA